MALIVIAEASCLDFFNLRCWYRKKPSTCRNEDSFTPVITSFNDPIRYTFPLDFVVIVNGSGLSKWNVLAKLLTYVGNFELLLSCLLQAGTINVAKLIKLKI